MVAKPEAPSWQAEADLLADGRDTLERLCGGWRLRHLYPDGADLSLLLFAYQELDRRRAVGLAGRGPRRDRRMLRRILRDAVRRDALARERRLAYGLPVPRTRDPARLPALVHAALADVDADVRARVLALLQGGGDRVRGGGSGGSTTVMAVQGRGLGQFRDALMNAALANPTAIPALHPEIVGLLASAQPMVRRHPIATLLFVRIPLNFVMLIITILNLAYVGAYYFFNDEVLGKFVSTRVSKIVEGDLEIESIHWSGRLIVDLVTGQPHHCVVKGVTVWEPYKSYGGERERIAAHADHIEASLVLHEIIPWNRLAIPAIFEVPWVLHFGTLDVKSDIEFSIRGYTDATEDGTPVRLIGLKDAFRLYNRPPNDRRGLSFQVDDAHLSRTVVDVDFREISTWRFFADVHEGTFALRFSAPDPLGPVPEALPLQFSLDTAGGQGGLSIDDIDVPLDDIESLAAKGGVGDVPYGDIEFDARALAAGSDVHARGKMIRGLARDLVPAKEPLPMGSLVVWGPSPSVELDAATRDVGQLLAHLRDELGLPPYTLAGEGAAATARVVGPLSDPVYHLAAEGLVVDPLDEPAWAVDDAEISVQLTTTEVPPAFGSHFPTGERMVATFDTFSGSALDGTIALAHRGRATQVVLPLFDDEPFVLAADLDLRAVNPGQLAPDDPETAAMLAGVLGGIVSIDELVLGAVEAPSPMSSTTAAATRGLVHGAFGFHGVKVVRDRGPEIDHIPKSLRVDGRITIDETGAIDFDELLLSIDGGRLYADGGVNGGFTALSATQLALDVGDGRAFTRALALPDYIDELHARIGLFGPLSAPSGRDGSLSVQTPGGSLPLPTRATMHLDKGVLHLATKEARLLGGEGEIDLAVHLFEKGGLSEDPRLRARVALEGVDLGELTDGLMSGSVDVELEVGDGDGGPARVSDLRVTGTASSPRVVYAGTTYHDVRLAFRWTAQELAIEQLTAALRRTASPSRGAASTLETGRISAEGTVGMQGDPALDLRVSVAGVPLDVVGDMLGTELPVRGQIGAGTRLDVGGTLSRPAVDGKVALVGLAGMGIPLGSGQIDVTSEDVAASGPLAPHRELRARGELTTGARGRGRIDWSIDAVVALGRSPSRKTKVPIAAQVDVTFARLSVPLLLRASESSMAADDVDGALEGLSAHVLTCNPGAPLLSDCTARPRDEPQSLGVELSMDRGWLRAGPHQRAATGDPCAVPGTLCTDGGLQATVDGTSVRLDVPLRLRSPEGTAAELAGSFDLSSSTEKAAALAASSCRPPPPPPPAPPAGATAAVPAGTGAHATLRGRLALQSVKALLQAAGLEAKGAIDLDLAIDGRAADAEISGRIDSEPDGSLVVFVKQLGLTVEVDELAVKIDDGWISARGEVRALGEKLWFGAVSGARTGYAFAGPCAGTFEAAVDGTLGARAIAQLLGTELEGARGGVHVRDAVARGRLQPELVIERAQGKLVFEDDGFTVDLSEGLDPVTIGSGVIDVEMCSAAIPCRRPTRRADRSYTAERDEGGPAYDDGVLALYVGGKTTDGARPRAPLSAEIGRRGKAELSGSLFIDPKGGVLVDTSLRASIADVFYRDYDPAGRPVAEAEVTSRRISLEGADPIVATGSVSLARGRYLKDAIQGTDILSFTEDVELPEAPPPDLLRTMQFELEVRTDDPLRVENNIATGVEASMSVAVTGTFDAPELAGRIDVEPGGKVELPFVNGTFEIQRGRVQLVGDIEDSEVDVLAMREEPIYIEDQARELQLALGGTLSGITWTCITDGDTSSSGQTLRSCFDYLVLGTGDVQVSKADVRRFGGGGLAEARKPLSVVGHVTEIDLGARAEKAVPRLRGYVPDLSMRLGQIGPELHVATPRTWFDFDYGRAGIAWDYTRGYPGFFLRQSRQLTFRLELLGPITLEYSRRIRSYLNERVVFDPLQQNTVELRFDVSVPSR